ncbi:MAG TPA: WD40 repeat domain-containing serine/threonine-protein kinase [Kofleriaceae bacterium]
MESGGNGDLPATSPATSPLTDPTRTSELSAKVPPGIAPAYPHLPTFPGQLRDPQRYEVLGEHGRGGIGLVSRAHDCELGRDIAIKELLVCDSANEARFLREALITARLEHPGIVPVYEAGRWPDGTPFYAMKLVSGRSLRDLIAERPSVEQRIGLLHHVIAVADAIAYAHGRHIIHRDLKPANVIVGEFGETIVIDWGLAKDLTSAEVPAADGGAFRNHRNKDLTSAGSILGTPTYMAPEQQRGEPVDQRADVFAIGVMLWELCTVQKNPPATSELRRRVLRRAGIDQDLSTIIDKALDQDAGRRYPDAGALAADLKAFKVGARIAARSYSLFAMLAHWTRRHRTLALSAATAIAIAATGSVLYVRNIAAERDRADASQEVAKRARAFAEASLDELTLKHAQFLLATDPSAVIDALARYQGPDRGRADQIRAEATGRGVASVRALPHTENVQWAQAAADGAILSLSSDGTIARTSREGGAVVLARGVAKRGAMAYSLSRHLLAYACDPSDVCLFDGLRAAPIPVASTLRGTNATAMSLSPNGTLLALISGESVLMIFVITDPARPVLRLRKEIDHGGDVEFIGDDAVAVGSLTGVELVRMNRDEERFSLPELSGWVVKASEHELALATARGQAVVLDSFPLRVAARATLCPGPITSLDFVPGRRSIAYACRDGTIGLWELQRGTVRPRAQLEGHADLISASPAGDYIVAAGGNGTVIVLDLETDLVTFYKGHGFRLTSITPPTPEHPFVISGDVRGAVRAWPLPPRLARVAATASSPFLTAIFDRPSTTVTATTQLPALTVVSPSAGVRSIEPHELGNIYLERSGDGRTFATYGPGDSVEIWSATTMTRTRVLATGHGSVSQLQFVGDTDQFITSGHDGRLIRWAPSGQQTPLAHVDQPIDKLAQASATGAIVFSTVDGALWRTGATGQAVTLKARGPRVNRILALPDQQTVYAGDASGDVIAIDTKTWRQEIVLPGSGAVREIAATRDGRTVAVATNDGTIHVGTRGVDASSPAALTWVAFAARARHIALAADGVLVVACTDGAIWLYSTALRRWAFLPTGTVDFVRTAIADDGKAAVVLDAQGRLLWLDLEAARQLLDVSSRTRNH